MSYVTQWHLDADYSHGIQSRQRAKERVLHLFGRCQVFHRWSPVFVALQELTILLTDNSRRLLGSLADGTDVSARREKKKRQRLDQEYDSCLTSALFRTTAVAGTSEKVHLVEQATRSSGHRQHYGYPGRFCFDGHNVP